MKILLKIAFVVTVITIASCQRSDKDISSQMETEPSFQKTFGLDSITSPLRKIIRQSDVEMEVDNVFQTITSIEKSTLALNGFIEESTYESKRESTKEIAYTSDSLLQLKTYTPTSILRLRVPQKSLDSFLSTLPVLAQHISYRTIRQSDASFDFIENGLKKQLNQATANQIKIKKADDAIVAANFGEQKINNQIENLKIDDKVAYSTISIQLTQPTVVERQVISNINAALQTPFTTRISNSLEAGLDALKSIFIFTISCWPFLLIAALYFLLKRRISIPSIFNK